MNLRTHEPMSPDPYGEFFSPYLAMGNNPVSTIDPDGGRVMRSGSGAAFEADNPGRERKVDPFDMKGTGGGGTTYYRDGMQIESWTVPKSTSGSGVTMSSANIVFTSYSYTTKDGKVTSWNHDAIWAQYDKGLNNAFGTSFPQLGGNGSNFNGTAYYSGQDQVIVTAYANSGVGQSGFQLAENFGQVINTGGVVYGSAEIALQTISKNNGAQTIGRSLGFGTQRIAQALRGTLGIVSKVGKGIGFVGYGLQFGTIFYKVSNNISISTAEQVGMGISTVLVGAAWIATGTVAAPFVAGGALIYGAGQLGSYILTEKTLEENYFGK